MIRKAIRDEQPRVMEIIRAATGAMQSQGIDQWDEIYPNAQIIHRDLEQESLYVEVAEGMIRGFIVLNESQDREYEAVKWEHLSGKQLLLHRLCIDPKYQGQGIARQLMGYAEQYGRDLGYGAIRLDAFVHNPRACKLYEQLGYKKVGKVRFRKGEFYCFEKGLG